jgi:hypothetical protein
VALGGLITLVQVHGSRGEIADRSGRAELEPVSLRLIKVMKKRPKNLCRLFETA